MTSPKDRNEGLAANVTWNTSSSEDERKEHVQCTAPKMNGWNISHGGGWTAGTLKKMVDFCRWTGRQSWILWLFWGSWSIVWVGIKLPLFCQRHSLLVMNVRIVHGVTYILIAEAFDTKDTHTSCSRGFLELNFNYPPRKLTSPQKGDHFNRKWIIR